MEAIPLPPGQPLPGSISPDSTASSPGTVKSGSGNSQNDGGRSSPPPNCAICLGKCRNKSFTDSCLHQFCFKCLLTWSKVKTECPLCKQNFKAIIHNVRSNQQYEEYPVEQPRTESIDLSDLVSATRRFRYRTTLTLPRRETLAIQQFLLHYPLSALIDDMSPSVASSERRRAPQHFRRTVYRHNLWARPLPDFTGRFRNCSPEFFRYNESQMHRLLPWLNRELYYLLNENTGHISYVLSRIIELLPQYRITSPEFRNAMRCYFGERTEHFLHEFYCFASTPYDLTGYDRNVQYQTDSRVSSVVNEVLSSSDSDASHDSDIVVVSSSHPSAPAAAPSAGPSRLAAPAPVYPRPYIPQPDVVPIETISHSESDSDSSVMVVGYIKPPHQRTPEQVDLDASDSDVVVQEEGGGPAASGPSAVKLTLSRPRVAAPPSDTDDEAPQAARPRRSRRRRDATPPPPQLKREPPPPESPTPSSRDSSYTPPLPSPKPPHSSDDSLPGSSYSDKSRSTSSDASSPDSSYYKSHSTASGSSRRKRPTKRRPKAKSSRRSARIESRQTSGDGPRISVETQNEDAGRKSKKSRNGKGVKKSKRVESEETTQARETTPPGPSAIDNSRKRISTDSTSRRGSRENKRLKSVVNVMHKDKRMRMRHRDTDDTSSSDSDSDNIPLHETMKKHSNR